MIAKLRLLAVLAAMTVLAGCASEYIISTNTGVMIPTKGKPALDSKTGMYTYKDEEGRKATISKDEVNQILER